MTAYDVDLVELRGAVAQLAACQRDLLQLAADIDRAHEGLHSGWAGAASRAEATSYDDWRGGCADMVTALAALRGVALAADEHYSRAVESNVALWQSVSA